ncbi:MAG TPA: hypothetical protein VFT56_12515 [Sphingomonas sp.]|nr:hypothetical protein [Sphingomonas sp.]
MDGRSHARTADISGVSPFVVALHKELSGGAMRTLASFALGGLAVEIASGAGSLWALVRRPRRGGLALRLAYVPGGDLRCRTRKGEPGEVLGVVVESAIGRHDISLRTFGYDLHMLRATVRLTPSVPLLVPFIPRDLYPLGEGDDPAAARGRVEAAQRGLNGGYLYFHLDEPAFGNVLYFQNLTALNAYFRATGTKPDGAVGGEWPELGYLLPTPRQSPSPPVDPLPANEGVTLSDAFLVVRDSTAPDESESARQFLQMLGAAYTAIDHPPVHYHDWIARADRTLVDLDHAPEATTKHYGRRYAHPYTASEYPDSMVQLSLMAAMRDYAHWRGKPIALDAEFMKGLGKFYDAKLGAIRRYLPDVGDDKNADAVDSWYLYHPLMNLGRLALAGDEEARALLFKSIDFGIKAAHHFDYKWPIQYDVTDFSVITETANDGRGQTDVGGMYAWVMLQAYDLTREERFLHEAQAAIDAAKGMRFNLNYQANLTAWGAAACLRLWRISNDVRYLEQSYVYLASFFHNCVLWESEIAGAAHYGVFLGPSCLQDAPYMAIYECFDSFAAFEYLLKESGPELEPAARVLVGEFCKYAVDRAWYYYPDVLPNDLLATQNRNGHIDRKLSFPLEDLYVDGQPAGQVGQEIYGAGAAFIFATRAFHNIGDAPFRLFSDLFILSSERTGERAMALRLDGGDNCTANLRVVRLKRRKLPRITLANGKGEKLKPENASSDRIDFEVPASGRLILAWD